MLTLLAVTMVIVLLFWFHLLRIRKMEPPLYPGALPLIGHTYHILGSITKLWNKLTEIGEESVKLGHPYFITLGNTKVYVLTDPEDCYAVAQNFVEKPSFLSEFVKDLLGCGLICSTRVLGGTLYSETVFVGLNLTAYYYKLSENVWHRHRRLMNPMFAQHMLDGFIQTFNTNAKRTVAEFNTVEGKGFFDSLVFMQKATIRNTFASLTGRVQYGDDKRLIEIINAMNILKELVVKRFQKIWLFYDTVYSWTNLKRVQDFNVNIIKSEIITLFYERKRLCSKSSQPKIYDDEKVNSFLDYFMQLEHEGLLSEDEVLDELITIVLSSYDTTSVLLTYALACVGTYPHIQDRLYQEILENISYDDMNGYDFNKTNLSKMFYLDAILKETLRSNTVFPIISRHLDKDIQIKNYTLYKGNDCILLINAVNKHSVWGKDALEFKPERWLNSETLPKKLYLNAGFGLGRRNCIGKKYAVMQSKVLLAHILMNYKILGNHNKIEKKYVLLLEPIAGHHISITRRKQRVYK